MHWESQMDELDEPWWRHQMETFSALLAICAGNSPVTGEFPAQKPVTRSFDVFFDLRLDKSLSELSRGDLRRYHAHYDVTVMLRNSKETAKVIFFSHNIIRTSICILSREVMEPYQQVMQTCLWLQQPN